MDGNLSLDSIIYRTKKSEEQKFSMNFLTNLLSFKRFSDFDSLSVLSVPLKPHEPIIAMVSLIPMNENFYMIIRRECNFYLLVVDFSNLNKECFKNGIQKASSSTIRDIFFFGMDGRISFKHGIIDDHIFCDY